MMEFRHASVLLRETIDSLSIKPDGIYVDGTLGGGGHSLEIARRLKDGRLIGIDRDEDAIRSAKERLLEYRDLVTIVRSNYSELGAVLAGLGVESVDGILLDLGVSSFQLDNSERGFTYRDETAPLDMRMDRRQSLTAEIILREYSEDALTAILKDYGEERFARQIARNIVKEREQSPIKTAGDLNRIIERSIPQKSRVPGSHPSKRTFQAIRIECNGELSVLKESIDGMIECLNPGGRLSIITFHSLEDRIVKNAFRTNENPCICPPDFPVCTCGRRPKGRVITKKPILPTKEEQEENKRSKSAKLRVFERSA